MRRSALILGVSRTTIDRKLRYLALLAKMNHQKFLDSLPKVCDLQFDDLQTIEHTKLKPLSVTMAVETSTRKILGFEVSRMPATGHLAKISRRKYGRRRDMRQKGIESLFSKISPYIHENADIISDEHPYYPPKVRRHFPHANYERVKGAKGCVAGQGELKKLGRDPLFSINHTFAMLRANINRLIRRTWCTTKTPQGLIDHLSIYVDFHNSMLTKAYGL